MMRIIVSCFLAFTLLGCSEPRPLPDDFPERLGDMITYVSEADNAYLRISFETVRQSSTISGKSKFSIGKEGVEIIRGKPIQLDESDIRRLDRYFDCMRMDKGVLHHTRDSLTVTVFENGRRLGSVSFNEIVGCIAPPIIDASMNKFVFKGSPREPVWRDPNFHIKLNGPEQDLALPDEGSE